MHEAWQPTFRELNTCCRRAAFLYGAGAAAVLRMCRVLVNRSGGLPKQYIRLCMTLQVRPIVFFTKHALNLFHQSGDPIFTCVDSGMTSHAFIPGSCVLTVHASFFAPAAAPTPESDKMRVNTNVTP